MSETRSLDQFADFVADGMHTCPPGCKHLEALAELVARAKAAEAERDALDSMFAKAALGHEAAEARVAELEAALREIEAMVAGALVASKVRGVYGAVGDIARRVLAGGPHNKEQT